MKGLGCKLALMGTVLAVMAGFASATQRWTGAAGTTDWTTAANWDGNAVPDGIENVYVSANGVNGTAVLSTTSSAGTFGVAWYAGGTSTLAIASGGGFSNTGTSTLGRYANALGILNVDGGQFISGNSSSDSLIVGYDGSGILNVSNGGNVECGKLYMGYASGGAGTLTIDGSGSALVSTGSPFVLGRSTSSGTLAVGNGGQLSTTGTVYMANVYSATATACVDGPGSAWKHDGLLLVGDEGSGTLYITNGGLVATGDLRINGNEIKADCFIRMTSGGMLAINADGITGDALADFMDLVQGSDDIQYLAGSEWVNVANGIEGVNYILDTYTEWGTTYRRLTVLASPAFRLGSPFSDNMVLQQQSDAKIWGWTDPGSTVTVSPSWTAAVAAVADGNGKWSATVPTPAGSTTQHTLAVSDNLGHSTTLTNVLIGEVWFCSGQSNMWWPLENTDHGASAIASPNPNVRLFTVSRKISSEPLHSCGGTWRVSDTNSLPRFSAVAYYFGRELQQELGVPIGLIDNAWGGTRAEPWTPREAMARDSRLYPVLDEAIPADKYEPAALYNGMVEPFIPFTIKGAIWYQGESNRGRYEGYRALFPALIKSWRYQWGQGDFPFYFVQLAPLTLDGEPVMKIPLLQEAQLYTMQTVPDTGMAVTTDIGNINDVHPRNKLDVGKRLSYWALAKTYGQAVLFSGPIYKEMVVEGSQARILFDYDAGGLASDGPLDEFTIAGSNMVFYPATAVIESNSVVVSSASVTDPAAVRYCWKNEAEGNLYNVDADLPASPFRTDNEELYDTSSVAPASVFRVSSADMMNEINIPAIDLDADTDRQVVVDMEAGQYLGQVSTTILSDNETIYAVYPQGHGSGPIIMKRSQDGGLTWSGRLPTPASWETSEETPTIHSVVDSNGVERLILWSGLYPARMAYSEDGGVVWTELENAGNWGGIVVMGFVEPLKTPGHYIAMFHDNGAWIDGDGTQSGGRELYQTFSENGGLAWSEPELVYASTAVYLCEPFAIRSPDGNQLAVLLRDSSRWKNSQVILSNDEGQTWSAPRELPLALTGDRHIGRYGPDGRLFISFRANSPMPCRPTRTFETDWVGWVGTYEDIVQGREGQYTVRLKENLNNDGFDTRYPGYDCGYSGVEVLPDGTFVCTTYGHWVLGENPYILSIRFTLDELDLLAGM